MVMRTFGIILFIIGAIMLVGGLADVITASGANLLSIALAMICGIGGAAILTGGAVVFAIASSARVRS